MNKVIQMGVFLSLAMLLTLTGAGVFNPANGADWPERDIILIVPYAAGGGYDVVARATAPHIEKNLQKKANVVVKNVPGAGGKIGFMEMVRSKADGYTIAVLDPADVAVLQVSGQLEAVDILKLSWLGRLDKLPDLLTVSAKSGFKTPKDMKSRPVRFAGIGPGVTFRSSVIAKLSVWTPGSSVMMERARRPSPRCRGTSMPSWSTGSARHGWWTPVRANSFPCLWLHRKGFHRSKTSLARKTWG